MQRRLGPLAVVPGVVDEGYAQGYSIGYDKGFAQGEKRFCDKAVNEGVRGDQ